ncbi:MAG TPA: CHRD domain-containing protein [Ktedonobacteraceae bacterium]|nr:CHRD domain-containing protein [Ktedonobacteraceae bacterium]
MLTRNTRRLFVLLTVIVALLVAACGGTSTPSTTPTATSAAGTTPTTSKTTTTATATLKHVPTGSADLSWDPVSQMLTVKISLVGLAPNSTHPAHIHAGSCKNQGAVVYPLQNVVADAHGVGTSTTKVSLSKGIPANGWYLNVHNGPGLSPSDQFLPIVCGDITNLSISTTSGVTVHLALTAPPQASTGENVSGTAQLTLTGTTLTVKLTVSGLEPNSSHAAHIHAGSCESQGNVVYPLTVIKADASGNATVTTTINNVSSIPASGWYVNVHHSTNLSTQTGFDPVACGNVTVG